MANLPVYRPSTPFTGNLAGGLRPNFMVRIQGKIYGTDYCSINFVNEPSFKSSQDVMLHISIRPAFNVIVRNHFQHSRWGPEERDGPCLVRFNETFEVLILAGDEFYKIAVNGQHLCTFRHRLPLRLAKFVHIKGDVAIDHVTLEQNPTPAMPHTAPGVVPVHVHVHHHPTANAQPSYNPFHTPADNNWNYKY